MKKINEGLKVVKKIEELQNWKLKKLEKLKT